VNGIPNRFLLRTGLNGLFLFWSLLFSCTSFSQGGINYQIDPRALYDLMRKSTENYDFNGIFIFEQGAYIRTFHINSKHREGQLQQALTVLDGAVQEHQMSFSQTCSKNLISVTESETPYYNFHVRGEARVAGLSGIEIILSPIGKHRYAYQYVIEPQTGLLLRAITLTADKRILERIQYTQLAYELVQNPPEVPHENEHKDLGDKVELVDVEIKDDAVAIAMENTEIIGTTEYVDEIQIGKDSFSNSTEIADSSFKTVSCNRLSLDNGWFATWLPEGFILISSGFDGERARLVYSDGLATISIFIDDVIESFLPPGTFSRGVTNVQLNYLLDDSSTYLISILGEVPQETIERVFLSLRRKQASQ